MPLIRSWLYPAAGLRLLRMTAKISSVQRNRPVSRSLLRLIRLSAGSWERCRALRDALRATAIAEIIGPLCDDERYKPVAFHVADERGLSRQTDAEKISQHLPDVLEAEEGGVGLGQSRVNRIVGILERTHEVAGRDLGPLRMGVTELLADRLCRRAVVLGDALRLLQDDLKIVRRQRSAGVLLLEPRHLDRPGGGCLPGPAHVGTNSRQVSHGIEVAAGRR